MFYGDYSYELVKERMDEDIRAHEHDVLAKQLRATRKEGPPPKGVATRGIAIVMSLFR